MSAPWPPAAGPGLAAVRAAVWDLDLATGELVWSAGMHALAGSDPATTAPSLSWWTSLVVPADRARVRAWLLVAREQVRGSEEQFALVGADGVERAVHAWVEVEPGPDGSAARLYGSAVDVGGLARTAPRDPLTQLPGRTAVLVRLACAAGAVPTAAAQAGGATGAAAALVVLDLDRFAVLADALGRGRGDALLAAVAARLRAAAPPDALVARLDGDRFAVVADLLVPADPDGEAAGRLADRLAADLLAAVRRPHRAHGDDPVVVTASAGVVVAGPAALRADDGEELLRQGTLALRAAQRAGRDRAVRYEPVMAEAALARLRSEAVLRAALDAGRLGVLYQPVIDLRTGEVAGVEALGRIVDPDLGPLSPAVFIDVAEETGLVVRLDEWVLGRASAMSRHWRPPASGAPPSGGGAAPPALRLPETALVPAGAPAPEALPTVAVNMSSRTLARPDLAALVAGALRLSGSEPSRLLVEITEHSLLDQGPRARDTLDGLVDLGVGVGIDDFGTGWSALSYLSALDLAFMKVDRCFVARLGTDASATAVVQAVIDLAHAHDLVVIAEGVETEAQARALAAMGCDHGQGWWFGRPQAEGDLDAAVRAWHDRARAARFGAWAPTTGSGAPVPPRQRTRAGGPGGPEAALAPALTAAPR